MSVTLTTSDLITIGGILTTVASISWAIYERFRGTKAREETKRFRHLLLQQQISQQFSDVPQRAIALFRYMRNKQWDQCAEAALLLSAELASLDGIHAKLIGDRNKAQLGTVLGVMREINGHIPQDLTVIPQDVEGKLIESCNFILVTVNAIERSLRVKASLGGGEDGE